MPRRRTIADRITRRIGLHSRLGRWGFSICAAFALLNGLIWPGLACTAVAIYAWKIR